VLEKISERTRDASPAATGEPPGLAADEHAYAVFSVAIPVR
jgi:hypothetical protein